jgi:hypothetical protein
VKPVKLQVELPARMVAGDHVIDEEDISGFILAGFPPAMHAVVVYRVRDGRSPNVTRLIANAVADRVCPAEQTGPQRQTSTRQPAD